VASIPVVTIVSHPGLLQRFLEALLRFFHLKR
jgi:hypothetical protein